MLSNNLLELSNAFLAVILAFLAADAVLQSKREAFARHKPMATSFLQGLIHFVFLLSSLAIFDRSALDSLGRLLWMLLYVALTTFIDYAHNKIAVASKSQDGPWLYISVQALHVCAGLALVWMMIGISSQTLSIIVDFFNSIGSKALSALTIYIGTIFAGGFLIRQLTRPLAEHIYESEREKGGLPNAGMYIGWLERCLIVTAVLMQSPTTVGLILAGKSIARFPELKDPRFAEYFLIGTLLSVAIAIAGGMLLQLTWNGSVQFK